MQLMRQLGQSVLSFALPPRCAGCGAIVDGDGRFCQPCWNALRFLGEPACARCGVPFEVEIGEGASCGPCLAEPPPWKSARAALVYDDISRRVAMRLKYGRRTGMARLMARFMAARVPPNLSDQACEVIIVPVPLHRWRIWSRGFNQAALIGGHLAKQTGMKAESALIRRIKATPSLRSLNRKQREQTVHNAFSVPSDKRVRLKGKVVLLVDDVHTSGATARACSRALLQAGAREIHLICWARVLDDPVGD